MMVMSIDCEYNQPSRKTIQIGAAIYVTKTGQLVAKFETYVNPGEPIAPFITELTGITDYHVSNAPSIKEAYEMLRQFKAEHGKSVFINPIVWGSGVRNDSQAIHEESGSAEPNFMGYRVIDAKSIYQSRQIFHSLTYSGSLETVCKKLKLGFEGQPHTALADAMNTFRVWHHLMSKFPEPK